METGIRFTQGQKKLNKTNIFRIHVLFKKVPSLKATISVIEETCRIAEARSLFLTVCCICCSISNRMRTIELKRGLRIKSKYKDMGKQIRQKIIRGEYFERLPGLRELAEEYNANPRTIRKALDPLINEGLLHLKQRSGIFVVGRGHHCIGIVARPAETGFFENVYYYPIFKNALREIEQRRDSFSYQERIDGLPYERVFRNNSAVDGLLLFATYDKDKEELLRLKGRLPFIIIGTSYPGKEISYVDCDNSGDSRNAVRHLIKSGHERIAFICSAPHSRTEILRLRGYRNALNESKIDFDKSLIVMENPESKTFERKVKTLFGSCNAPTALFGAHYAPTEKALEMLGETRNNLAVIVYDDPGDGLSRFNIPYGAITQPLFEIGRLAIEKLYGLITGDLVPPVQIKLRSKLIFEGHDGR